VKPNDWVMPLLIVLSVIGEIAGFAWLLSAEEATLQQRAWALIVLAGVAAVIWLASQSRGRSRGRWEP